MSTRPAGPPLEELVRAAVRGQSSDLGEHPVPDTLLAYHQRSLPAEDADLIRAHLAGCPSCAGYVIEFSEFLDGEPPPGAEALSEHERVRAWKRLEGRLEAGPGEPPAAQRWPTRLGLAAAGLIGIAVGLVSMWGIDSIQDRSFLQPVVNSRIISPIAQTRTAGAAPHAVTIPADQFLLPFELRYFDPHRHTELAVAISAVDGDEVWGSDELLVQEGGVVRFALPRRLLDEGTYRIRLYARSNGERALLATYSVALSFQSI